MARRAAMIGPALLAITGTAMAGWTWRAWPDPIVDFGRELYVPWRLAEGEALFTDIAWFNGPLSQHWNALWFRLAGVGLMTLVWVNLAVLAATLALLYGLLARASGRTAATAAGMVFLLVFAFGQYLGIGNYNWVTPYSHEVTHGVALAVATLVALERWARTEARVWLLVGGLAAGLCALTKVEAFLAAAAAGAVLLAPALARRDWRAPGILAVGFAAPVAGSTALVGWAGTVGGWTAAFGSGVAELSFYRAGMGLDRPGERTLALLAAAGCWLLVLAPMLAVARLARSSPLVAKGPAVPAAAFALTTAALVLLRERIPWGAALLPLPLFTGLAALGFAATRRRELLAFAVLGLVLLAKMILYARVAHYGFALALPATLAVVAALVGWLPAQLDRRGWRGDVLKAGALALIGVFAFEHVNITGTWLARRTVVVGAGRDAFRSDVRGAFVNDAVARVEASGAETLAVVPEGVGINYLARIPNPTPYINFMPPEELLFGEESWTAAFRAAPPDVVLVVPKDTSEYGRGAFGEGYGRALAAWIDASYRSVGDIRREGVPFGIRILARGQTAGQEAER